MSKDQPDEFVGLVLRLLAQLYLVARTRFEQAYVGLRFRLRFSVPSHIDRIRRAHGLLGELLGLLGKFGVLGLVLYVLTLIDSVRALLADTWEQWLYQSFWWRLVLVLGPSFLLISFLMRRWASKELLFRFATQRLNDRRRAEQRATENNIEAEWIISRVAHGGDSTEPNAFDFLVDLWAPIIERSDGVSLLPIGNSGKQAPVVVVDGIHGDRLDTIISVERRSHFKDYGAPRSPGERLIPRAPWPRYLRRYRGPTTEETQFKDDYVGLNCCLRTMHLEEATRPPLVCSREFYGNIMDSSDSLIEELYLHFALRSARLSGDPRMTLRCLPWRHRVHKEAGQNEMGILTDPGHRAAGVGIAALTVYARDDGYVAMVGTRSSHVGTYKNRFHVIPAGMTNLSDADYEYVVANGRLDLRMLIEKEFFEEVFSEPWAVSCRTEPDEPWPKILSEHASAHLYGANDRYNADIHLTGVVFDLLNYRPEVCALVLIRDPSWWNDHRPHPVWEVKKPVAPSYEWNAELGHTVRLDRSEDIFAEAPREDWVLSGLAAYCLGTELARTLTDGGNS